MLMLRLNETIDQLSISNSVHLSVRVFRNVNDNIVIKLILFEIDVQRKKGKPKWT